MKHFTYKAANVLYEVETFDDGWTYYYRDGYSHRENGPAIIWTDGSADYHLNGVSVSKEKQEHALFYL